MAGSIRVPIAWDLYRIVPKRSFFSLTEELLVLIEQRQRKLKGKRNDDQHNRERAYNDKRHLPAGDEHRDEYADKHNAGLYQHTYRVLQ